MPANRESASVKIFRFDPSVEKNPRYETFNVSYDEGASVLNVLNIVYHDQDPQLSFRWGCEGAHDPRCGACAMMVNNRPVLSCRKPAEKEMIIDPHPKFSIIKDIAVDFNKVRDKLAKRQAYIRITIDLEKCVKCGDCVDICPVGVYKIKKGEIIPTDVEYCCGETCNQCVIYCQKNAITVETV